MNGQLITPASALPALPYGELAVPLLVAQEGERAAKRYVEFFAAQIRNPNTRRAYARAAGDFLGWCERRGLALAAIEPVHVAAYIELLLQSGLPRGPGEPPAPLAAPSVKQRLAAVRMLCNWFVVGQVVPHNPAASVRDPKHVVARGKTPVLPREDAKALIDAIETATLIGLRDRALIGTLLYTFARIEAALGLDVGNYFSASRKRWRVRLHEKGGKVHEMPVHHTLEEYLDAYIEAAGIARRSEPPSSAGARGRARCLRRARRGDHLGAVPRERRGGRDPVAAGGVRRLWDARRAPRGRPSLGAGLPRRLRVRGRAGRGAAAARRRVLREVNRSPGPPRLPRSAPTGSVRGRWVSHVLPGGGGDPDRRYYEFCVLSELRDRLRAGDVWVTGSRRYRSFEERLVPREALQAMQEDSTLPVAVEADFCRFIGARRDLLAARLAAVDRKARGGLLPEVTLERGVLRVAPVETSTLPEAEALAARLHAMLPRVRITDLLSEVARWTALSGWLLGREPWPDRR